MKPTLTSHPIACLWIICCLSLLLTGCGSEPAETVEETAADEDPPVMTIPANSESPQVSVEKLRRQLGANENAKFNKAGGQIREVSLWQSGVTDISPLKGLPLKSLDLGGVPVKDLNVLKGMPLEVLVLEETGITDLSVVKDMPLRILKIQDTQVKNLTPLRGLQLEQLNLKGTPVENIDVVADMPLGTLWIPDTKITDLSPLEGKRLESLDVQQTPVDSLEVLRGMTSLKRLNIAESKVTDLTPLEGLTLDRLIFTPTNITKGLDVVRNMPSLRSLGTGFDTILPAERFWQNFDAGQLPDPNPTDSDSSKK